MIIKSYKPIIFIVVSLTSLALGLLWPGLSQVYGAAVEPSPPNETDMRQMNPLTHTLFLPIALKPEVPNGGEKIVFSYGSIGGPPEDIFTINPDGTERINLTNHTNQTSREPAWSPDKTRIAFSSDRDRIDGGMDIYVMNADGTNLIRLTNHPTPVTDRGPTWSPDGTKIAFYSDMRDGDVQREIYVMNADGTNLIQLTNHTASEHNDLQPNWSPDGAKLAIVSTRDTPPGGLLITNIYVINADGSGGVALTDAAGSDWDPRWSPDGTKIAFTTLSRHVDSEVYVVNADGSGLTRLTFAAAFQGNSGPVWSADGSRIAFLSRRVAGTTNPEIYLMNTEGSNQQRLTTSLLSEGLLDW